MVASRPYSNSSLTHCPPLLFPLAFFCDSSGLIAQIDTTDPDHDYLWVVSFELLIAAASLIEAEMLMTPSTALRDANIERCIENLATFRSLFDAAWAGGMGI